MSSREERIGLNEAVFREVNERIEDLAETFDLRTQSLDLICECGDAACVERISMTQRKAEQREHALCAVQEGKAFLCLKGDGGNLCALQRDVARQDFLLEFRLAFADDDLREMSQRREIARSAY